MKTAIGLFWGLLLGLFTMAITQEHQDPSLQRIGRFKMFTGEGRLVNSVLLVKFRQDQRFTRSNTYFVTATAIDSSTAQSPDSVRTFVIKNLSANQFTIRSVKYASDTIKVRWLVVGE